MAEPAGVEKERALRSAGFNDTEVEQWRSDTARDLQNAGFNTKEVGDYFGAKEPNMAPTNKFITENLKQASIPVAPATSADSSQAPGPAHANSVLEAIESGLQISTAGLVARGKAPDIITAADAPRFYRIASSAATLAGDVPAMIAGGLAGAVVGTTAGAAGGSIVPGVGTIAGGGVGGMLGAGAGTFAIPAGMRRVLMDHYEKGDIQTFGDFWDRASGALLDATKQGIVGAATTGVGSVVGKAAGAVASPLLGGSMKTASEIGTMVTVGNALDGKVPNADEFIDAAMMVGAMHGVASLSPKLRNIYSKTGDRPADIAQAAQDDILLKQDLLASNVPIPKSLKASVEATRPPSEIELPSKESVPDPATLYPTPEQKILSKVGDKIESEGKKYSFNEFYTDFVDKLDPIHDAINALKADETKLSPDQNPYQLTRMANDYRAKTKHIMENGTLDYATLAKTGKSFKEILDPFKEDADGLRAYLVSKRALEIEGRGLKSGFDADAADKVVSQGKKKYDAAAKDLVEFQNANLKYLKDSGVLSEKSYKAMVEAGNSYIPFSRLVEPDSLTSVSGKSNPIKRLKGSAKAIQDPLLSIIENTETLTQIAEKNRATRSLVDLATKTEGQTLLERVTTTKEVTVSEAEVAKFFKENNIAADPKEFSIFRKNNKELAASEFEVYRDGKREVYRTDEALAKAIKSLDGDPASTNLLFKLMNGITTVKKLGITLVPDFAFKNLFRDQLTAGTFTKGGTVAFKDMVGAMGDIIKKNDDYYRWLKSGGANGTFLDLDRSYLESQVFKLNKETGFIDSAWNVLKKPVDYMRAAAELAEQSTRLAEFKRVTKGASSGPEIFRGGFASREVTVDFSRVGAKMAALNSITAFQNVSIQGLDRTIRAIKEDPKGVAAKAAAYITVPSVLLWYANKDDPRYQEIPRWQKDLFWIIPTKNTIYRIPKPQELGMLFGSVPERLLETFFTDHPNAMEDFEKTVFELVTPSFVPDAISPAIEQHFNKSLFTGSKIIPAPLEDVLPAQQYTEYSSQTAKTLGKFVALIPPLNKPGSLASPLVLDNYIRSWSGPTGTYIIQVADKLLTATGAVPDPIKPAATLADIPFVKAFVVRYPSASAQSIQDFYDKAHSNVVRMNTLMLMAKDSAITGDVARVNSFISENQSQLATFKEKMDGLTKMSQYIKLVYKMKNLTPDDKRQQIDGVYYGMIEIAKQGNKIALEFEKEMKAQEALLKKGK